MGSRTAAGDPAAGNLTVIGLGPGDLARLPGPHRAILEDPGTTIVVRTMHHPAAAELARLRAVESCDDLYQSLHRFEDVYDAIVGRILERARHGATVYAVPGSPLVGEFAVRRLLERVPRVEVIGSESFVDAVLRRVGYDPFERGLRILNGHELPFPLVVDGPAIVGHLDAPVVLADVAASLARVLPDGAEVTLLANLGCADESIVTGPIDDVDATLAGFRTSMFIDVEPAGLVGAVQVNRRLREECPWDRRQTHAGLVSHLIEECHELADALAALPEDGEPDYVAYDAVEEELGDVMLQVLFHAAIASERGVFDIDDVATRLRQKLVRRHPHVFGDIEVSGADEVVSNWERIKADEKQGEAASLMDGVSPGMSALERAAKLQRRAAQVGFDWDHDHDVVDALAAEVEELRSALGGDGDPGHELGDIVFTVVNLARRLELSPEVLVRRAIHRFEARFRAMEGMGPLAGLDMTELERRWSQAKRALDP